VRSTIARLFSSAFIIAAVGACSQPATPERETPAATVDLGESITWAPVDGAVEYRVQLWDGVRLLFEESREQTMLPVTPVMRRSLVGVTRAELQVRAYAADGGEIGEVQRRLYPAGAS